MDRCVLAISALYETRTHNQYDELDFDLLRLSFPYLLAYRQSESVVRRFAQRWNFHSLNVSECHVFFIVDSIASAQSFTVAISTLINDDESTDYLI